MSKRTRKAKPGAVAPSHRPPPNKSWSWTCIAGIVAAALLFRGLHLYLIRHAPVSSLPMGDAASYDRWAQRLAGGDWIGDGVFYQAPLYPYFMGVQYALLGHSLLVVQICQSVLGAGACALLGSATARLFGRRAGLAAGLMLAVYAPAVFFDGLIQKTVLDSFFLCALVWFLTRLHERRTASRGWWAGAALGCLILTRENSLAFVPVIAVWLWGRDHRAGPAIAAFVGAVALILAPVTLRNFAMSGEFHTTTFQAGSNFYIGNSASATGAYVPLRVDRGTAEFEQQDATELAEYAVGHALSPSGISAYWRGQAWDWISHHPMAWLKLTGKKAMLAWNDVEAVDTEDVYTYASWSWPIRLTLAVLPFGVLAPLSALGLWLARARFRDLWLFHVMGLAYIASVVLFFVLARYRYPIVPFLIMFAGASVAGLPAWWRSSHAGDRAAAAIIVVSTAVLCNWPMQSRAEMQSAGLYNIGYALANEGRIDEAIANYRAAVDHLPVNAAARANLGSLLSGRGDHEEALPQLQEAVRLAPELASARIGLGIELAARGQSQAATQNFRKALELEPQNARAHYNLGVALAAAGDTAEALPHLREAVRLDPALVDAQNNLGVLLSMTGQVTEAMTHFTAALALRPGNQEIQANLERARQLVKGK